MYHPAEIERLSHAQIGKLLRGQSVRMKLGKHHKMHLSQEQHKKLHKAHLKGAGVCICLDPYQMDMHHHLKGEGMKTPVASHHIIHHPHHLHHAHHLHHEMEGEGLPRHRGRPRKAYKQGHGLKEDLHHIGSQVAHSLSKIDKEKVLSGIKHGLMTATGEVVKDARSSGRPIASSLIHKGIPSFTGALGGVLGGLATENPAGGILGGAAGSYAGTALADYIGHKTGYGMGGLDGISHGMGLKKKQHRKKKLGGALFPAGY